MELTVHCRRFTILFLLIALAPPLLLHSAQRTHATSTPEYTFKVVRVFPNDTTAFTQGLAYDSIRKRLFVTGKLWPSIFEINLIPKHLQ
jgi:glutamine cyclotransferase